MSGANSLMLNVTPGKYKSLYKIYENKVGVDKDIKEQIASTIDMLMSIGRAPTDIGIN